MPPSLSLGSFLAIDKDVAARKSLCVSFVCNCKWAPSLDFSLYPILQLMIVVLLDVLFIYKFQMYSIRQTNQCFYFPILLTEKLNT